MSFRAQTLSRRRSAGLFPQKRSRAPHKMIIPEIVDLERTLNTPADSWQKSKTPLAVP
jgi:hypothetical protein